MITKRRDAGVEEIIARSGDFFLKRFYRIYLTKLILLKNFCKDSEYHTRDSAAVVKLAASCANNFRKNGMSRLKYRERPEMSEVVSILGSLCVVKKLSLHCSSLA